MKHFSAFLFFMTQIKGIFTARKEKENGTQPQTAWGASN